MSKEMDDLIRRAAGRRVPIWQDEEEFARRKPLEGEELERETNRLFGVWIRGEVKRQREKKAERFLRRCGIDENGKNEVE